MDIFPDLAIATDVEGIFRLSGSAKRIKELQVIFDSPDRYGKGLDWAGYTVHDAANILRRYLTHLPQPIVPLDFYDRFRDPLRRHQVQAIGDREAQKQEAGDVDSQMAIATYQQLITELPPLNRQLLLYILDLLAVFASKSDVNLMTSANLAAIFQPGLLSHPTHDMSPQEYRLSQDVLIFLIDNQDSFLIGMNGTAVDEKTVKEVQSGAQTRQPNTPTSARNSQIEIGRSVSNASGGADSLRKYGGLGRNVSVSSKNSKRSINMPSPATPTSNNNFGIMGGGVGVHRSNTVPSKKSPGLSSPRYRGTDSPTSPSPALSPSAFLSPTGHVTPPTPRLPLEAQPPSTASSATPTAEKLAVLSVPAENTSMNGQSNEQLLPNNISIQLPSPSFEQVSMMTPSKQSKIATLFSKSPPSGDSPEGRQPNKLRKKRVPNSTTPSAHSSTQSLHNTPDSPNNQPFYTPMPTPGINSQMQSDPLASAAPTLANTAATPSSDVHMQLGDGNQDPSYLSSHNGPAENTDSSKSKKSPATSLRSRNSLTDVSDVDHNGEVADGPEKHIRRHRWRFSNSAKSGTNPSISPPNHSSKISPNMIAEGSASTVGSWARPRKSMTNDSSQLGTERSDISAMGLPSTASSTLQQISNESATVQEKEAVQEATEKKGPIGWFKAKVAQAKEEQKERKAEKERAKSPPRNDVGERVASKQSLSAIASETFTGRGRSIDMKQDERAGTEKAPEPTAANGPPQPS